MKINDLLLLEGDLGMASFVVNLHRFDVGSGDFAVWTLVFRVSALLEPGAIFEPGLSAAAVRGGRVDLGLDLLRRVLLRLGFARHGGPIGEVEIGGLGGGTLRRTGNWKP